MSRRDIGPGISSRVYSEPVARCLVALALVSLTGSLLGCSSGKGTVSSRSVGQCVSALEAAASAPLEQRIALVARGCAAACPGLGELTGDHAKDDASRRELGMAAGDGLEVIRAGDPDPTDMVTRLLAGCQLFCTDQAAAAWRRADIGRRFELLDLECGVERYGLDQDHRHLLSTSWLVLHRIARWLGAHRNVVDRHSAQALDGSASQVLFPVAPPARVDGLYELATSLQAEPVRASFFVIVTAEHRDGLQDPTIHAGAMALARLSPGKLAPVAGRFPGQPLGRPAADYRAIESQAGQARRSAPLLLGDRDIELVQLLRAISALELTGFTLGVAGYSALAHPIEIELLSPRGSAAPLLRMRPDEWIVIGDREEEVRIPVGTPGRTRLARELHALSVRLAPQRKIEVEVTTQATVADLVAVLDIIAESKFAVALLKSPETSAP